MVCSSDGGRGGSERSWGVSFVLSRGRSGDVTLESRAYTRDTSVRSEGRDVDLNLGLSVGSADVSVVGGSVVGTSGLSWRSGVGRVERTRVGSRRGRRSDLVGKYKVPPGRHSGSTLPCSLSSRGPSLAEGVGQEDF